MVSDPKSDLFEELPILCELLQSRLDALIICLSHAWGGLEQVAAYDALDLGVLGLKVRILCLEGTPIHVNLVHRREVSVLPIDFKPRDFFDFKLRAIIRELLSSGVNLIHCHQTSILGSIVPWLWTRPDIPLFASRHIMNNHNKRDFFHQAIYSRLDALIVMSQALRRNVLNTHAIRDAQVKVVNLGLDFEKFDPNRVNSKQQRVQWGVDEDTTVIGLVGRIDPAKGQAMFIKAAAGLLKEKKFTHQKLKFIIAGDETAGTGLNHLTELKEMVTQFHINDHVLFLGYQSNIPEVMNAFDIAVMPSRQEAFGLVAIEAMAMECPIIISSGGSTEEIVGQNEFGLTMRPDDPFDLQQQLKFLLENREARIQMGKRAREYVKCNYDRKIRLQRTLALYERSLRRRGKL